MTFSQNPKILVIHSSPNLESSQSRKLTQILLKEVQEKFPKSQITQRDLAVNPVAPLMPDTIEAVRTQKPISELKTGKNARKLSDELVKELMDNDIIVIGAPMYNFNIPSTLKAYIDYITRSGVTFGYDPAEKRSKGLIKGKKVLVIITSGGTYENTKNDHQGPYLQWILNYLGLAENLTFVRAEGLGGAKDKADASIQKATQKIQKYVKQLG